MPRVPDEYLECVVYLYPDIPSAEAGKKAGGSGFIVRVPGELDRTNKFDHIVTNRHVIDDGNTTVRFNSRARQHESFEYDERNWVKHPDSDLAAFLLPEIDPRLVYEVVEPSSMFLTRQHIVDYDIGIGNEVFFVGRFINAEGKDWNRPSLRFGTIAQAATDKVDDVESFLVEARSIPGFSGSPVFFYRMAGVPYQVHSAGLQAEPLGPWLLGVDWCHITDYMPAFDAAGNKLSFKIRSNSGMMGVIPTWHLESLLFGTRLREMRKQKEREIARN